MTDTGAGTPLTDFPLLENEDGAPFPEAIQEVVRERERDAYRAGYQTAQGASRPATDPAGLDALREAIADAETDDEVPWQERPRPAQVLAGLQERGFTLARLSVADGPGPEERPLLDVASLAAALQSREVSAMLMHVAGEVGSTKQLAPGFAHDLAQIVEREYQRQVSR